MLHEQAKNSAWNAYKLSNVVINTSEQDVIEQAQVMQQRQSKEPSVACIYQITKRGLDICGAVIGLVFMLMLLPIIALCILCEDQGPIFYRHIRVGQYGKPFVTYKFRSMFINADDYLTQNPQLWEAWKKSGKLEDDPRITRIGRFLRHTSIDEMPQLLNVLRGEISLVGPRAIQMSEVERLGELVELRQSVKPGLTGLWQVSGRSMIDYEQRVMLDCIYVLEHSFWMDILILLKTIPAVIGGEGAY